MGKNPFDACLSIEVLEKVESIKRFQEAREKTLRQLRALNEVRKANISASGSVEHHRESDHDVALNRPRSDAERVDQEARDKLHRAAREHDGPTRVPVVEPWSLNQEFTSDAPSGNRAPLPVRQTFADLRKKQNESVVEEEPEKKEVTGIQVWGVFLVVFFGIAWLCSCCHSEVTFGGAVFSFFICAGLAIGIFQMTVLFSGDSGIGGGGKGGGSFNGSAV